MNNKKITLSAGRLGVFNVFVSSWVLSIFGACTTTSDRSMKEGIGSSEDGYSDELTGSGDSQKHFYSGPMAVKQIGNSQIAYSREGNQYWYNLRDSNDPLKKIAGHLAHGQTTQAISGAKNYLEKNPQDIQALTYLSTALALDKKYTLALYYAKAGLRLRPGDAMLLNTAGLSLYLSDTRSPQDRKTAIEYLQASFRNDSSQIASGLNLGGIFLELGKPTEAQVYYQASAKRCGQCKTALLGSGNAHLKNKNYSEAKEVFEKILAQEPSHGPALYNLAVVYRNGYQNRKQAEKYLFTLLNRTPKSDYALRARAQTFLRMMKGEMDKSERSLAQDDYESIPQVNKNFDDTQDAEMLMTWGTKGDTENK